MASKFDRLEVAKFSGPVFNIKDKNKFDTAIALLKESLFDGGETFYCSDNIITWNRNYSFVRDPFFQQILTSPSYSNIEKAIVWRTYVLIYFANIALSVKGDFLECGCFKGYTAKQVVKKLDLSSRSYYLYDRFSWEDGFENTYFSELDDVNLFQTVKKRFRDFPNVTVVDGSLPESLSKFPPGDIAFCHIDLNDAESEYLTFKAILPFLTKGAIVIFDDYGWWGYSGIKNSIDSLLGEAFEVLELPTGQGVYFHR